MSTPLRILSLGAGVQSSTLALMSAAGELPPLDFCVFADTQAEPDSVYQWLSFLEQHLPIPIRRVTYGSLAEKQLEVKTNKDGTRTYLRTFIPAFVTKPDGSQGMLGRKCTTTFKVEVINRELRRILGVTAFRKTDDVMVEQWLGISRDEAHRMKPSQYKAIQIIWPLIDKRMTRMDCLKWLKDHGYPEPPRSACYFCPFHSDAEWFRLKTHDPTAWNDAVAYEDALQEAVRNQNTLHGMPFLHRSGRPLREVQLEPDRSQLNLFGNECAGMCGV